MPDYKREAARHACQFIKNNDLVGLGAGSTIAHIVEMLKEKKNELSIQVLTSSFGTLQLLQQHEFHVIAASSVSEIDIYFDGCDQFDKSLNALKSGGGIHTREKILASMARQFLLVGDEGKYVEEFDSRFPVVLEILPEALKYVLAKVTMLYPQTQTKLRTGDKKEGAVITDNGNYLTDVWFNDWPEISSLHASLKSITGVVETSLFYNLAHKAVIAGINGIRVLEKQF